MKEFDGKKGKGGNKLLTILVCIAAAVAVIILLSYLFRSCNPDRLPEKDLPDEVLPTPPDPEIGDDDIVPSPDSLTYEVNRRIILIIQNTDKTPAEFVKEFRKVYPDKSKYVLSAPDMIIPRFVLTLPPDEKAKVESEIVGQFPEFDLLVLPESLFTSDKTPSDPDFTDATKRWYFDMCDIQDAWDDTMGSSDIIIAVIDDGFDLSHPEFAGQVVDPYNAVYHNSDITPSPGGHGTHVATTAVGRMDNSSGLCGIAPLCKLMPIQVGDSKGQMTTSAIIDGVLYAISKGAHVVNMSIGRDFGMNLDMMPIGMQKNLINSAFLEEESVWRQIFKMGINKGMAFVLAGGNDNVLIGIDPIDRIEGTIRVSAVQPDRYKADFSNYGPYSTLSAPGISIYSALPGNEYGFKKGTSMASPIVAGCVALMKSKNPNLTNDDIIRVLQETGIPSPSDVANIVNFHKAMDAVPGDGSRPVMPGAPDCDAVRKRYQELLDELNRLKRDYPECTAPSDTLVIPPSPEYGDLTGLWKSTTPLFNTEGEEVTVYYSFDGGPHGKFILVDPSGTRFEASLDVTINGDEIKFFQTDYATAAGVDSQYIPYTTICRPDPKTRVADCVATNQEDPRELVRFNLVKIK